MIDYSELREHLLEQALSKKFSLSKEDAEDLVHDVLVEFLEAGNAEDPLGWCRHALSQRSKDVAQAQTRGRAVFIELQRLELPFGDTRNGDDRKRLRWRRASKRHRATKLAPPGACASTAATGTS